MMAFPMEMFPETFPPEIKNIDAFSISVFQFPLEIKTKKSFLFVPFSYCNNYNHEQLLNYTILSH